MPKDSPRQRRTVGRVMHEFKHGELDSARGGKVRSRKQAIAIALSEAGESKYQSKRQNRKAEARSERKEAKGDTGQQEREGKSHVGARGKRESTRAMGGKNATRPAKKRTATKRSSSKRSSTSHKRSTKTKR